MARRRHPALIALLALHGAAPCTAAEPCRVDGTAAAPVLVVGVAQAPLPVQPPLRGVLRVLRAGDGLLLAARAATPEDAPDGRLLRVPCRLPPAPQVVATEPGADFGASALSADGTAIYYSARGGVAARELADPARVRRVATAPPPPPDRPGALTDRVLGFGARPGVLVVARGLACPGPACRHVTVRTADGVEGTPWPVASVAADRGGAIWLADGSPVSAGRRHGSRTDGAVWRSADRGFTWTEIAVDGLDGGAWQVMAGGRGRVLVLSADGRRLLRTRNGGRSWALVPLPKALGDTPPAWVAIERRRIDWLRVPGFRSTDGGRRWRPDVRPPPAAPPAEMADRGTVYRATADGLVVTDRGATPRMGFPDATPSCRPRVDAAGHLLLGERPVRLPAGVSFGPPKDAPVALPPGLSVYPDGPRRVLLATRPVWDVQDGAEPSGELWRLDCRSGRIRRVVSRPGADFGHAARTRDGRWLFFGEAGGARRLDLATLATTRVTRTGLCAERPEAGAQTDLVLGLEPSGGLRLLRGGACGYEADWVSRPVRTGAEEIPHPVTSVTADAAGHVWLADGGRCDEPGVADLSTPGHVWRSEAGQGPFAPIRIPEMGTAARMVLADATRPGHLLVLSAWCRSGAASQGGSLYLTRDGGVTWTHVPADGVDGRGSDDGDGITAARLIDGSVDRMRVWGRDRTHAFETRNAGARWGPVEARWTPTGRFALAQSRLFEARADGLYRTPWPAQEGESEVPQRVFPMR